MESMKDCHAIEIRKEKSKQKRKVDKELQSSNPQLFMKEQMFSNFPSNHNQPIKLIYDLLKNLNNVLISIL